MTVSRLDLTSILPRCALYVSQVTILITHVVFFPRCIEIIRVGPLSSACGMPHISVSSYIKSQDCLLTNTVVGMQLLNIRETASSIAKWYSDGFECGFNPESKTA